MQLGDPTPASETKVRSGYSQKPSDLGRGELPGGTTRHPRPDVVGGEQTTAGSKGASARIRCHSVNPIAVDRNPDRVVPAAMPNPTSQIRVEFHDELGRRKHGALVFASSGLERAFLGGPQDPAQAIVRFTVFQCSPLTGREDPSVEARVLSTRARL